MNRDSTRKLKTDRRLVHRRGWISKTELQKELDALPPDVSDKIAPPEDSEGEERRRSGARGPPAGGMILGAARSDRCVRPRKAAMIKEKFR